MKGECVDQIFTQKEIVEKAREKKRRVRVSFMDLEKACDKVNRGRPYGRL